MEGFPEQGGTPAVQDADVFAIVRAARVSCKAESNVAKKVAAVSAALPAAIATHPAFALVRPLHPACYKVVDSLDVNRCQNERAETSFKAKRQRNRRYLSDVVAL